MKALHHFSLGGIFLDGKLLAKLAREFSTIQSGAKLSNTASKRPVRQGEKRMVVNRTGKMRGMITQILFMS